MSYEKITKDAMFGIVLLCVFICVQAKRLLKFLEWLESPTTKKDKV